MNPPPFINIAQLFMWIIKEQEIQIEQFVECPKDFLRNKSGIENLNKVKVMAVVNYLSV